jgi:hypothetical protein
MIISNHLQQSIYQGLCHCNGWRVNMSRTLSERAVHLDFDAKATPCDQTHQSHDGFNAVSRVRLASTSADYVAKIVKSGRSKVSIVTFASGVSPPLDAHCAEGRLSSGRSRCLRSAPKSKRVHVRCGIHYATDTQTRTVIEKHP